MRRAEGGDAGAGAVVGTDGDLNRCHHILERLGGSQGVIVFCGVTD